MIYHFFHHEGNVMIFHYLVYSFNDNDFFLHISVFWCLFILVIVIEEVRILHGIFHYVVQLPFLYFVHTIFYNIMFVFILVEFICQNVLYLIIMLYLYIYLFLDVCSVYSLSSKNYIYHNVCFTLLWYNLLFMLVIISFTILFSFFF